MNKKLTITSLIAEVTSWGWELSILSHSDSRYGIGYDVLLTHPDHVTGHALKIAPGDDEQLRAVLQSLLREIREV